jgi:uncharacterized protein YndB with AHSA1/START domain
LSQVVVEQRIAAPPATVYRYLTESEKWVEWQSESASLDPREGGLFALVMANGMRARGQFTELDPPKKVVFTWGWVDRPGIPPGSTVVTIELTAVDGGTRLVLTHSDLPEDERAEHRLGWETHLPRLAHVAAGG